MRTRPTPLDASAPDDTVRPADGLAPPMSAGVPARSITTPGPRRREALLSLAAAIVSAACGPPVEGAPPGGVGPGPPADAPPTGALAHGLHRLGPAIVTLLASAEEEGLDPADYGVDRLRGAVDRAASTTLATDATVRLDAALDAALSRYLTDLRTGRVDPREIHQAYEPPAEAAFDVAAAMAAVQAAGTLAPAVREATPVVPAYAALRDALARCRALGSHAAWTEPLVPLPRPGQRGALPKVEPGQDWPGAVGVARRLVAWGDLPAMPVPEPTALDEALAAGLRAFQRRHGLTDDGVLGHATLAALQVTPAQRARQVALTMERLRWTPLMQGPRMIVVNLPEFVLRAYEVDPNGRIVVREQMKVIVGRALDTRTPQFDEPMRFIEFSPYWNVPDSIARRELVPRLRRDPGTFAREGFEFVDRAGRVLDGLTPDRLDAVLTGTLRLRQRPGERNALGDIKFVFPNRDSIFLHHTPATALFARDRRDLSHGCIRVEHPVALARFVLQDETGWTEPRIRAAMAAGTPTTQALTRPLPVLITYGTALVLGGRLHFFEDVYGHDRVLEAALQRRVRPALPAP